MGLLYPTVRLLNHFRDAYAYGGRLLTIGRQEVYLTPEQSRNLFDVELPRVPEGWVDDVAFFTALGFAQVDALDHPDALEATIPHDLNTPLDPGHHGSYDTVLDVGTLEHVFNAAAYMTSIVQLLAPGGTALHLSPTQGGANHGFYCFQPTFFFSFYAQNGFTDLECHFVELPSTRSDADDAQVRVIPIDNHNNLDYHPSTPQTYLLFRARKGSGVREPVIPMQEFYRRIYAERERLGVDRLPDDLYRTIVGAVPENAYERIMERAFWV